MSRFRRKLIILLVCFLVLSMVVLALVVYRLYYPHVVEVVEVVEVEAYLNNILYLNGTTINWGSVEPGKAYRNYLSIKNVGNVPVTVYFVVEGLPVDWSLSWQANGTSIDFSEWANGTLTLTLPEYVSPGIYRWESWVLAVEP